MLEKCVLAAQSCLILCDPMDCSTSGSSVHGISQVRILESVAISFSRGSSQPRDQTQVSCTASRFFTVWAIREVWRIPWTEELSTLQSTGSQRVETTELQHTHTHTHTQKNNRFGSWFDDPIWFVVKSSFFDVNYLLARALHPFRNDLSQLDSSPSSTSHFTVSPEISWGLTHLPVAPYKIGLWIISHPFLFHEHHFTSPWAPLSFLDHMAAVDRIWECEWSYVWGFEEVFGSTFRLYLKVRYWTPVLKSPLGFLGGLNGKESACNVREPDSIPGRYPGEGNGYSLQYSWLENPMTEELGGSQRVGCDWSTNSRC